MDIFEKVKTDQGYFGKLRASGDEYFTQVSLDPMPGHRMKFRGQEMIMWSVNNYIGLAEDEELKNEAVEATKTYGLSAPMGSRMMSGTTDEHLAFEKELADFEQKEDSILFNYGYLGVMGTIASLVGKDDTIVMDKLSHASIVDGVFNAQSNVRVYKHNNMESLEIVLKRINKERKGGILLVGEGVYGMTGDLADLKAITDLKDKYDFRIFVDDAHGCGVMGEEGRGTPDYLGVQDKIDIYFGTFAKSFAAIGGFSAADHDVVRWIKYNARTQVFAKSLPMAYVRTLRKTLQKVRAGDENRDQMWKISAALKEGLGNLGYTIGPGQSPICSVFAPVHDDSTEETGARLVHYLRQLGVFVTAVIYPVIPLGLCMFRMIPTTSHTMEDVERTIAAFKQMRDEGMVNLQMNENDAKNVKKVYGLK